MLFRSTLTQAFEFVDLVYIEGLFSKGSFIDFLKKSEREKIEQELNESVSSELNRGQQRKGGVDVKKEIKKLLDANDKQYDDIAEIIKAIRQMIPYDRMLVSPFPWQGQWTRILLVPSSLSCTRIRHIWMALTQLSEK